MANKVKDPMDAILANIEKSMGNKSKPVFTRFGNIQKDSIPVISFGIKDVDEASNSGGVPRGKIVEIFGPESSGKSLLSLYLIASAQKQGLECALVDAEQSFDPIWAARHGVDVDKLVYSNDFDCGENALEYAYRLCESGAFGLVVIDSTAALTPKSELEGSLMDNARLGEQARMLSRGCRKIVQACGLRDTTCVFINQIRDKIGVTFGDATTTPGGRALKFYSHQRIKAVKVGNIYVKQGKESMVVGQKSIITFVKNKTARPWGKCELQMIFDVNATNPIVMLANTLRAEKMVSSRLGLLRISKDVIDNDKPIETGATTMIELAKYLIQNDLVIKLIDKIVDEGLIVLDDAILELKEDPTKIVAPNADVLIDVNIKKIGDASPAEIAEVAEEGDDEKPPEED